MSINIENNNKDITQIIIENILKMLHRRELIDSVSDEFNKLIKDIDSKNIFSLTLNNNSLCGIYFINNKLSSIIQNTPLDDYLSNNIDIHKIIIGKDVTKKVIKQIMTDYTKAEFFFESEMLEDIPSKLFIPVHKILNNEEKEEILSKFSNNLSKILVTDIMSRHLGAKIGDIIRIERASFTAGKNIFYRKVFYGSIDILF